MGELRNRSIRVDDDVWAAIQRLPGKTNDALRVALLGEDGQDPVSQMPHHVAEILELSRSMAGTLEGAILQADAAVTQAVFAERSILKLPAKGDLHPEQPADNRPKNVTCRHCGARFAGQRFATICSSCKSDGHTLTPAECPICNDGRAI